MVLASSLLMMLAPWGKVLRLPVGEHIVELPGVLFPLRYLCVAALFSWALWSLKGAGRIYYWLSFAASGWLLWQADQMLRGQLYQVLGKAQLGLSSVNRCIIMAGLQPVDLAPRRVNDIEWLWPYYLAWGALAVGIVGWFMWTGADVMLLRRRCSPDLGASTAFSVSWCSFLLGCGEISLGESCGNVGAGFTVACTQCGAPLYAWHNNCCQCGAPWPKKQRCPACGYPCLPYYKFCPQCAHPLSEDNTQG